MSENAKTDPANRVSAPDLEPQSPRVVKKSPPTPTAKLKPPQPNPKPAPPAPPAPPAAAPVTQSDEDALEGTFKLFGWS